MNFGEKRMALDKEAAKGHFMMAKAVNGVLDLASRSGVSIHLWEPG